MHCIYDAEFHVNRKLLDILLSFSVKKILVVNGFREKGKKATGLEAFSLEEDGIKKKDKKYFQRFLSQYKLKTEDVLYIDHSKENITCAQSLGIRSLQYTNDEEVQTFLKKYL